MRRSTESTSDVKFAVKPLPYWLRVPGFLFRRSKERLVPEQLTRAASRRAGLPNKFSQLTETALEVLCRSLRDDAELHWFGEKNIRLLIVTGLAELLKVDDVFRRQPDLNEVKLNSPLIVTGLPRSGTTFLHRLLSSVEESEPIPFYRHLFPVPRRMDTRLVETLYLFEPWRRANRRYQVDAMHFVRPRLPDECNLGMRLGMQSLIFWATAPTYGYLRWLLEQDMREAYQLYRRVLIIHQMRRPNRRLTLKCPHHIAWLPAMCEALPEAHVVQTHRDIKQTIPSDCKLVLSLQSMSVSKMDWRESVVHNRLKVQTFANRSVDFAKTDAGGRVKHVDYRQILSDPLGLAQNIHDSFGFSWSDQHQATVASYCKKNRQHKHGTNRYTLEQFELDADSIDVAFRDYRQRFLTSGAQADCF